MRSFRRLFCVLVLVAALGGCDSDQPLQVGTQTVALTVDGGNVQGSTIDVYIYFLDNDGDLVPDNGELYDFCWRTPGLPNPASPPSGPVGFGIEVKVLRAGSTEPEVLTAPGAIAVDANIAEYDPTAIPNIPLPSNQASPNLNFREPLVVGMDTYRFCGAGGAFPAGCTQGVRTSVFSRRVVSQTSNPLTTADPMRFTLGNGLCSLGDPGPAVVDGAPSPFTVDVEKGDTVIVTLKRGTFPPELIDENDMTLFQGQPSVSGSLTLDGLSVTATGSTTTAGVLGSTVSFSLTTR